MVADSPDLVIAMRLLDHATLRERTTSLLVPDGALVEHRVTGDALNVLNAVLTWDTT